MKDHKQWVSVQISETAFNALMARVSEVGKKHSDLIADYIDRGLEQDAKNSRSLSVKIHAASFKDLERRDHISVIDRMIASYQEDPTEELLDQITYLCGEVGLDVGKMFKKMEEQPYIAEVLRTDKVTSAEMWLLENLKPNEPVFSTDLEARAAKAGIKKHVLFNAKNRLNERNDLFIKPTHKGTKWIWELHLRKTDSEPELE